MTDTIRLNNREIEVKTYEERRADNIEIQVTFDVTSGEYSELTGLLYEGTFDVVVPDRNLDFRAEIINYFSDLTNLYEANQVAEYNLTLKEVSD